MRGGGVASTTLPPLLCEQPCKMARAANIAGAQTNFFALRSKLVLAAGVPEVGSARGRMLCGMQAKGQRKKGVEIKKDSHVWQDNYIIICRLRSAECSLRLLRSFQVVAN